MDPRKTRKNFEIMNRGGKFTSGLGSQSNEQIESNTLEMVNAGDH